MVADEAVDGLESFLASDGAVDEYLADQLLLPLAFASGLSTFRTARVTRHLITNVEIVQTFLTTQVYRLQGRKVSQGL